MTELEKIWDWGQDWDSTVGGGRGPSGRCDHQTLPYLVSGARLFPRAGAVIQATEIPHLASRVCSQPHQGLGCAQPVAAILVLQDVHSLLLLFRLHLAPTSDLTLAHIPPNHQVQQVF